MEFVEHRVAQPPDMFQWIYADHLGSLFNSNGDFSMKVAGFSGAATGSWLKCGSQEGWGPISSEYEDFTPCFWQGVLYGLSAVLMIVLGSGNTYILWKRKITTANRMAWSFYLKLLLVGFHIVFSAGILAHYKQTDVIQFALFLNLVATLIAFGLHYIEQFKSSIPSGVLLFYWLGQIVLNLGKVLNFKMRGFEHSQSTNLIIMSIINAAFLLAAELYFPFTAKAPWKVKERVSPFDKSNLFSRLMFTWMSGLMKTGYQKYLTMSDLPPLPKEIRAANTSERFLEVWNQQKTKSIPWALAKSFGWDFFVGGLFKGSQDVLAFVQPQLLKFLIKFITDYSNSISNEIGESVPLSRGYIIAVAMFVVALVQTIFLHQYFRRSFDMGMQVKSALVTVVYNKSLILSNDQRSQSNTGDIVNLMAVDSQRLQDLMQNLQIIWSGPFQITLCLYSLHKLIGNSMWAGLAVMLIMIPVNASLAKFQKKLQRKQMKIKDERTRLVSEIITNIKSLKLYSWEKPYLERLNSVRNDKELKNLKRMNIFIGVSTFCFNLTPFLVSCSTFAALVLYQKKTLSTQIVFPALALFNLLNFPLAVLPQVVTNVIEAQVAIDRLTKFLTGSELQSNAVLRLEKASKIGDTAVSIKNGTFLWSKAKNNGNYQIAVSNANFKSKKGHLDCIVGKVGSGKSSIIQAILGDLYKLDGEVRLHGKVAYVSQIPWIMNATIKENILFGHKYDAEYYEHVLKACALNVDLKILPKGDMAEVGEKGISLSGGQKARLSLARAVYARADVYLLDDPLSAVDEHVGQHLIDHVLGPSGLLKSKCKILATNSIKVLSIANNLHMVSEGRLIEQGTYDEIMALENSKLKHLIEEFGKKKEEDVNPDSKSNESVNEEEIDLENLDSDSGFEVESIGSASTISISSPDVEELLTKPSSEVDEDTKRREEKMEQGKVKWSVYLEYIKACNLRYVFIYSFGLTSSIFVNVMSNVWLKHWSEVNSDNGYNPHVLKNLGIYFSLGFAYSVFSLVHSLVLGVFCSISGSKKLHNKMALSVVRAPMMFFETTPVGRILNRFSNDINKIDEIICRTMSVFLACCVRVCFTLVIICFSTWQFIFMILPIAVLYIYYQQYYLKTSRELKRLDFVSRSPIYANFQESLVGISTIRAFGQQGRFRALNEARIDKNFSAFHPAMSANRWLAVRLEVLGSLIILGAAGLSIVTLRTGKISAGLVGLSVSYALQTTQNLNWIVRTSVDIEGNIVSVERIIEYSSLPSEAPEIVEEKRPSKEWPSHGAISFNNYSTKYRPELDPVLKGISFDIKPKEKIGIVGRTGAGKSSVTLALFRIIEKFEGSISIDNVDISEIGLFDLRSKLSIIPQDSQVFEGTIRSNLDPNDRYSDEEIWNALELSHLKSHVQKMSDYEEDKEDVKSGLDVRISEGGSNLSSGQRQLMCLARVLLKLKESNILVLDEATAAVDVQTDQILQNTIRQEFKDKTIITIAHRLNTIMDSDKILVLDSGRIAEFDSPQNLLKLKDSFFYSLCQKGGFVQE